MDLSKEFIETVEKIVVKILEIKKYDITENTLQEIKNKWNDERLKKTEAILNSYKPLNDFIKNINFTDKEFKEIYIKGKLQKNKNNNEKQFY